MNNPWPGPSPPWGPPPPQAPPPGGTLKTLGILAMVFAGLTALGDVWSILQAALGARNMRSFGGSPGAPPEAEQMMKAMSDYTSVALRVGAVEGGVMLAMSIALFVIGLLLLQRKELGRKAAIVWSIVAFVVLLARGLVFELVTYPAFAQFLDASHFGDSLPAGGMMGWMSGFARVGEYASLAFMAVFPIVLLVILTRPNVKATAVA